MKQSGMSLIEVLVMTVIASLISLAMSTMFINGLKSTATVETKYSVTYLRDEVRSVLGLGEVCLKNFQGKNKDEVSKGFSVDKIINSSGESIFQADKASDGLTIQSLKLQSCEMVSAHVCKGEFSLNLSSKKSVYTVNTKPKFSMYFRFDPATNLVSSCSTQAEGLFGTGIIWSKTVINPMPSMFSNSITVDIPENLGIKAVQMTATTYVKAYIHDGRDATIFIDYRLGGNPFANYYVSMSSDHGGDHENQGDTSGVFLTEGGRITLTRSQILAVGKCHLKDVKTKMITFYGLAEAP